MGFSFLNIYSPLIMPRIALADSPLMFRILNTLPFTCKSINHTCHLTVEQGHISMLHTNICTLHTSIKQIYMILWSYAMCEIIFSPHLFIIAKMQNLVACIKYKYAQPLYYTSHNEGI